MEAFAKLLRDSGMANLAIFLEGPEKDVTVKKTIQSAASTFASGGTPIPCELMDGPVYDLGSTQLNHQIFAAGINCAKSPELLKLQGSNASYAADMSNTGAVFIYEWVLEESIYLALKKPTANIINRIIAVRTDLADRTEVFDVLRSGVNRTGNLGKSNKPTPAQIAQSNLTLSHIRNRVRGLRNQIVCHKDGEWGLAPVRFEQPLIVQLKASAAQYRVTPIKIGAFKKSDVRSAFVATYRTSHSDLLDTATGLRLPAPAPHLDQVTTHPIFRDSLRLEDAVGGGGGGGGGIGGSTTYYSGTGSCQHDYTDRNACYSCCDWTPPKTSRFEGFRGVMVSSACEVLRCAVSPVFSTWMSV